MPNGGPDVAERLRRAIPEAVTLHELRFSRADGLLRCHGGYLSPATGLPPPGGAASTQASTGAVLAIRMGMRARPRTDGSTWRGA